MHNQDLGRVAVVARGIYDPLAAYERLDAVSYNGSSYLVRKHCQGVEPAEGEYYMLMAQAGDSTAAMAAAAEALAAAQMAASASERADTAAGSAEQQASAAGAAAASANAAAGNANTAAAGASTAKQEAETAASGANAAAATANQNAEAAATATSAANAAASRADDAASGADTARDAAGAAAEAANAAAAAAQDVVDSVQPDMIQVKQTLAAHGEALDNRIKKFYTNSLGETTLADSDDGPIRDLILFGRSRQDGTPTPDAPVEIQSVVNPTVTIRGKNLFDKNAGFMAGVAINNEGVTYPAAGIDTYGFVNIGPFRELSFTNVTILCVFESDKSTVTRRIYLNDAKTKILFTDTEKYYRVSVAQTKKDIAQIEAGDATQYAPYQVQTATLPYTLNAIPVSEGGNVTIDGQQYIADYVDVERKKLVRKIGKKTYDGSESWSLWNTNINYLYLIVNDGQLMPEASTVVGYMMCDKLPVGSVSFLANNKENGIAIRNTGYQLLVNFYGITDSLDSFKTWLSENQLTIVYALNEQTEIDLSDEEVQAFRELASYYPTTNVSISSDQLDGYNTFDYPVSLADGWNYVKQQLGDTRDYIYDMDERMTDAEYVAAMAYVNSEYAAALTELEV